MTTSRRSNPPAWHRAFLVMLTTIRHYAQMAFGNLRDDNQNDAVQEVIANACVAFVRLTHQDRSERAFPTVLVRYAIAQVRERRRVGSSLNARDVLSPHAKRRKNLIVERLDKQDLEDDTWIEAIVEDSYTPVLEQVWFRIDLPERLARLSQREREIAELLAMV
jgi:hypothetical protein